MSLPPDIWRYLLWQVPGWTLVGLVAAWASALTGLPPWAAAVGVLLFVAKDLLLYPVMKQTFRPSEHGRLVGARGHAVEPLAPAGYVRVNGELWRAEHRSPTPIAAGARVVVRDARGLTLIVDEEVDRPR